MNTATRADREELRFRFGENWQRFLANIDEPIIGLATASLKTLLGMDTLQGQSFVDVGSGSGLFSLAARRLGAQVVSFDFDEQSVACTQELKRRYFPDHSAWTIARGSILDEEFVRRLDPFDVVYSWGVLHHTGAMWQALGQIRKLVAPAGLLALALYNDQGRGSRQWAAVKKTYNRLPEWSRMLVLGPAFLRLWGPTMVRDSLSLDPLRSWRHYGHERGMSPWRDVVDWVGGYPFEVAKPEQIFEYFSAQGFTLEKLKTCAGGHGCNEFVFVRGR